MTKSETVQLFAIIKALFPRDDSFKNATKDMVDAWAEMLGDIPFDHAKAAVKAAVATSPFPPSIAEIRDYATRLNGPRRLTAEEAWGIASDLIRNCGTRTVRKEGFVPQEEARNKGECYTRGYNVTTIRPSGLVYEAQTRCPDPEIWAMLQRMGWKDICESDNPDVVRGQFMRAWSSHDVEAKEVRVIGGVVPELVAAITETVLAQLGAGDE